MVPTESLLSRILDEMRGLRADVARLERRLAEVERPNSDMWGRNQKRRGKN